MFNFITMQITNTYYKIVFQPKEPANYGNRRRFGIGVGSLADYIGQRNAESVLSRIKKHECLSSDGVIRVRLRNTGVLMYICIDGCLVGAGIIID